MNDYSFMIQKISVKVNLGREHLEELGKNGPYHRYVNFPVETKILDIRFKSSDDEDCTPDFIVED